MVLFERRWAVLAAAAGWIGVAGPHAIDPVRDPFSAAVHRPFEDIACLSGTRRTGSSGSGIRSASVPQLRCGDQGLRLPCSAAVAAVGAASRPGRSLAVWWSCRLKVRPCVGSGNGSAAGVWARDRVWLGGFVGEQGVLADGWRLAGVRWEAVHEASQSERGEDPRVTALVAVASG